MLNRRLPIIVPILLLLLFLLQSGSNAGARLNQSQDVTAAVATIQLDPVLSGLSSPVFVTHAGDGSNRLFIVEQTGAIKVLQPDSTTPTVFLNIASKLISGGERGLLGLAFHPQFAINGKFFVNYTRQPDGATVIAQYRVSNSNPDIADTAEVILLTIAQPFDNHNGGMLAFGPDGFLYIAMGDGGSGNDPDNRAQNVNELLGKILRIDVDHPNGQVAYSSPSSNPFFGPTPGRDEIYAFGMRNPWRFSFDRQTGQLYVADVGQSAREEVDIVTLGGNYGWRIMEGTICNPAFNGGVCTPPSNHIPPITEYGHTSGRCSITGGYVYRGQIATLTPGDYIFADFCTGEIFLFAGGMQSLLLDTTFNISSFGEDEAGELYVAGLGGTLHRIINPNAPCSFAITPTSKTILSQGGTASVLVTTPAGCNWTAASNSSFIHITSEQMGMGRGLVSFSVDPLSGANPRSGTMTIAGHVFTVNQSPDTDADGMPDVIEAQEGTNPQLKDNDIFANARWFAMQQYRDFLGREGESSGINFWANQINSGNQSRAQVIDNFFRSDEFQATTPVTRLYFAYFLRIPDYTGLLFWVNQYRNGMSLDTISQNFAGSAEFIQRYGNLSNEDYVTLLYQNVLGRAPDQTGYDFWVAQLNSGAQTRGQVMLNFSESAENIARSNNSVYVVDIYVGMLKRVPEQSGFDFWVNQMNQGASGLSLIQNFFSSPEYHMRFLP